MSISRHIDEYLEENELTEKAEVVPENECQQFEKDVLEDMDGLEEARRRVEKQLWR